MLKKPIIFSLMIIALLMMLVAPVVSQYQSKFTGQSEFRLMQDASEGIVARFVQYRQSPDQLYPDKIIVYIDQYETSVTYYPEQ